MNKHGQVYIWEILPRPHQSHLFPFVENHIKLQWPMGTEVLLEADVSSAAVLPSVVETKLSLSPWLWVTTKQHNKTWQPLHMGFLISCFSSYGGFKACVSSAANNTVGGGCLFAPYSGGYHVNGLWQPKGWDLWWQGKLKEKCFSGQWHVLGTTTTEGLVLQVQVSHFRPPLGDAYNCAALTMPSQFHTKTVQ